MINVLVSTDINAFHMHTQLVVTRYSTQLYDQVLRWITSFEDLFRLECDVENWLLMKILNAFIGSILLRAHLESQSA